MVRKKVMYFYLQVDFHHTAGIHGGPIMDSCGLFTRINELIQFDVYRADFIVSGKSGKGIYYNIKQFKKNLR